MVCVWQIKVYAAALEGQKKGGAVGERWTDETLIPVNEGVPSEAAADELVHLRAQAFPALPRRRPCRMPRDLRNVGGL